MTAPQRRAATDRSCRSEPSNVSIEPLPPRAFMPSLELRLKRRTRRLRQLHGFFLEELGDRLHVPLASRLRALRHGFSSRHWRLYDLDRNDPGDYLPSFADLDFGLERPSLFALRDKLAFSLVMAHLGARSPRALGFISEGRLLFLGDPADRTDSLALLALRHGGVVVKPLAGVAGQRITLLTVADGALFANHQPVDDTALATLVAQGDGLLVTELALQGRYAEAIAPRSVNTVRLLTMWDEGLPFLAAAAHRFGLPRTYPIDNFHGGKGGLSAPVDLDTGIMGSAATLSEHGELVHFTAHPDSGASIAGGTVPGWPDVVAETLRVAGSLPQHPYVGWDLVVTDEGASFLEANAPPGTLVWQVHGGLLCDPRVRRACAALGLG